MIHVICTASLHPITLIVWTVFNTGKRVGLFLEYSFCIDIVSVCNMEVIYLTAFSGAWKNWWVVFLKKVTTQVQWLEYHENRTNRVYERFFCRNWPAEPLLPVACPLSSCFPNRWTIEPLNPWTFIPGFSNRKCAHGKTFRRPAFGGTLVWICFFGSWYGGYRAGILVFG